MQEQLFNKCPVHVISVWHNIGSLTLKSKTDHILFYIETQLINNTAFMVRGIVQIMANTTIVGVPMGQYIAVGDNMNVARQCLYAPGFITGETTLSIQAAAKLTDNAELDSASAIIANKTKIILL